jgi:O-antigen ligase
MSARPYLSKWRKVFVLGMPGTAALGVIGCSSRGALLGMGAIGFYALLRSKQIVRTLVGIAVLSAAVWFILPAEQKARFSSAGEDKTSIMRKVYWLNGLDMARTHPALGIGYNNWMKYYYTYYRESETSQKYNVYSVQVPHNIFIQCMAELGYIGLAVLVLLIGATLWINYQTREVARTWLDPPPRFIVQMAYALDGAMLSYIVAGFFVTVLYYPFFWINLALTVALSGIARQRGISQHPTVRPGTVPRRGAVRPGRMIAPR